MTTRVRLLFGVAASACAIFGSSVVHAQTTTAKPPATEHKMQHGEPDGADHAMSAWKELDAYHMHMMATWHPAKNKGDMAPTRAKIGDMVTAAKTLAASTPPKACAGPKVAAAAKVLPMETQKVADLVAKKADDATLKAAMRELHDKFEVVEGGCEAPKGK